MFVRMFWITPDLAIMPRPRGDEWLVDEMADLRSNGLDVIVSLLDRDEETELGLLEEARACEQVAIAFLNYAIQDRGIPQNLPKFVTFIKDLKLRRENGAKIAIHCRAGIGRSSLTAASLMVACGADAGEAFDKIAETRGCPVPDTEEQRQWVVQNASAF